MRLGLLAAARITDPAVVEPSRLVDGVELGAIAARSRRRAEEAAAEWKVPVVHSSYDELVADESLDAVYVATPAALHGTWTMAALAAGKHVLCEKPLAADAPEARQMVAAAEDAGLILMEAFHWRYHPFVAEIRAALDAGAVGAVRRLEVVADLPATWFAPPDIRWDLALGGGALMDIGCYALHWARWVVAAEPKVVSAEAQCPVPEVDGAFAAELAWDSGVTGSIRCSMIAPGPERELYLRVIGDTGVLTVHNPVAPQDGASFVVENGEGQRTVEADTSTTTYFHQLIAFRDAVANGIPPLTSGADSIANMELIDSCYLAAGLRPRRRSGRT